MKELLLVMFLLLVTEGVAKDKPKGVCTIREVVFQSSGTDMANPDVSEIQRVSGLRIVPLATTAGGVPLFDGYLSLRSDTSGIEAGTAPTAACRHLCKDAVGRIVFLSLTLSRLDGRVLWSKRVTDVDGTIVDTSGTAKENHPDRSEMFIALLNALSGARHGCGK